MAEERFEQGTTDDQHVLSMLMQRVRGLTIVSTPSSLAPEIDMNES